MIPLLKPWQFYLVFLPCFVFLFYGSQPSDNPEISLLENTFLAEYLDTPTFALAVAVSGIIVLGLNYGWSLAAENKLKSIRLSQAEKKLRWRQVLFLIAMIIFTIFLVAASQDEKGLLSKLPSWFGIPVFMSVGYIVLAGPVSLADELMRWYQPKDPPFRLGVTLIIGLILLPLTIIFVYSPIKSAMTGELTPAEA